MSEPRPREDEFETHVFQARAELALALANLRDGLTPAHILTRLGQDVRARAAPLVDPLMAHAKSASGMLVLAGTLGALAYGIGRQTAPAVAEIAGAAAPTEPDATVAEPVKSAKAGAKPRAKAKGRARGYVKALLISAAGLGTGALVAASLPVSDREKRMSGEATHDLKRWARDHSGEIMAGAVNAFGVAKGVGSLLGLLALAASFSSAAKKGN